jgi:hypothetical protein
MADYQTYIDPQTQATTNVRQRDGELIADTGIRGDIVGKIQIGDYDAPKAGEGFTTAKTAGERDAELQGSQSLRSLLKSASTYDEAFEPMIYGTGKLENAIATYTPFGTDTTERQADWWKEWKFNNELVQRHEMFGSALTESEQREWAASSIDPSTRADRVQSFLKRRSELALKVAEAAVVDQITKGRDPERVLMLYGDAVDVEDLARRMDDGSYWEDLKRRQAESRQKMRGVDSATLPLTDDLDAQIRALELELNQ